MDTKICAIISGGEFSPLDSIKICDYIIACDKGLSYAIQNNIHTDLIIGDFDSFLDTVPDSLSNIVTKLPSEKDDTDTLYAVKQAIKLGYKKINLYCALGGRLDHLFANIQTCIYAINNSVEIKIIDTNNYISFLSSGNKRIQKKEGYSLSLISITDCCIDVSISDVKYPLKNYKLTNFYPIGISNEFIGDFATVSVKDGILAIIQSKL